jgi:multicomponent K+:H+ antiporter subunit F
VNALLHFSVDFAAWCSVGAMMLVLIRLFRGPSAQDRVLALDALYSNSLVLLLILGIRSASSFYFDVALLIALFGFIGTTALAKFLLRGEVIEP